MSAQRSSMSPSWQAAIARGRAYDLFAAFFRDGLTEERLPHLQGIASLAPHLPAQVHADEAAARHYGVLQRQVQPFASVFLSEEGLLGGEMSSRARDLGARSGFVARDEEPDHLSELLALLAGLCGAEADAYRDGQTDALARIHGLQREILGAVLLRFLPVLVPALRPVDALYAEVAELALELAADHWMARRFEDDPLEDWALPQCDDLLSNPKVGLKAISRRLTTPGKVGVFWAPEAISQFARELEVGTGFGKRWQMVEVMMHGAAHQDRWDQLCGVLEGDLIRWMRALDGFSAWGLGGLLAPWQGRIACTGKMLGRMRDEGARAREEEAARSM